MTPIVRYLETLQAPAQLAWGIIFVVVFAITLTAIDDWRDRK